MYRTIVTLIAVSLLMPALDPARAQPVTPFKLGTFEHAGRTFVGVVLDDARVIDLAVAHARTPGRATAVAAPRDMQELIRRYDRGLRERILEIVAAVGNRPADRQPDYVHAVDDLKVRPPIMYPRTIMNTALNYTEHALEMEDVRDAGGGEAPPGILPADAPRIPGIWDPETDDRHWNPYMFLKSSSAVIAHGEAIRLPPHRDQIDWECELGVVIGRETSRVQPDQAAAHIFGYTLEMDVSDRAGRGDGRYGSDWLIGKSHDTFAPLGPFIIPREFVADPQDLDITFSLNGEVMQDTNTSLMIHDVFEQVAYASNILTLQPGDVIGTGTPAGVGSGRTPPVFLQDGDDTSCTYEGIGTLENTVVRPAD